MTQTARLYGGSLYELAAEEQLTEVMMQQIQEIRGIFRENPEYLRLLAEPSIPFEERKGLIETAFGAQTERYLVNFIKLLCERNLLTEYAGCCEEFIKRYHADHGIVEAVVISAVALSQEQATALQQRLEKVSDKKVSLTTQVDPTVLGGIRVELEGKQLDGTIQGRLTGISKKLNEIIV